MLGSDEQYEGATVIEPKKGYLCPDCDLGFQFAVPVDHDGAQFVLYDAAR